ncbi:hypothetical protein MKS83_10630 [Chryseobacterium sp. Y16C]|uniref:hypothetical protein n=1 Tax=Chryseobacterium sp. Y16C TaxID=2920939 RepID=UPI001F0CD6F5|nr:hypothetical protein [Chryseobacterium sp. Y16C]UMQ44131.1 hypothetical protein MKS83_10630 [Chryseobacterium sp. Y16C]
MKKCSYCGKESKLTKEHIWPKCIIKRAPELNMKYLESQKKVFSRELVISDVCSDCNNTKLSYLDAYICQLYDRYFKFFKDKRETFEFECDYDLLLRSLLKITYNSSRTIVKSNNFFQKYKDYILEGGRTREDIIVKLDIVIPAIIDGNKVYPKSTRCGTLDIGITSENFIMRTVAINSYYFSILFSKEEQIPNTFLPELNNILQRIPGSIINPYDSITVIKHFSNENTISVHEGLINKISEAKKDK